MWKLKSLTVAVACLSSAAVFAQSESSVDDLSDVNVSLEEVEVLGVRQADLNARLQERQKEAFSSIIATDDVGNFADQNVAESLRRLPGVSLQRVEGEGKFVTVRGLGPKFVSVSINGSEMAGAGDEREFSLDSIPSDMLGSIEVFKTLTPDMNLNSIGGAVNVKTVSALDKGKDSLRLKVQGTNYEKRDAITPRYNIVGTHLFSDGDLGVGYTLFHEKRKTAVDETRAHSTGEMLFRQQNVGTVDGQSYDEILAPRQLELRQETADRTRVAGSLNIEYRNDSGYYYAKLNRTEFEDVDIARREFVDFQDAGSGEIGYANAQTGEFVLSDVDVFQQFFIQTETKVTSSLALGGENTFGDSLTVDYELALSNSDSSKPDGRRTQFRERDLVVIGRGGAENIYGDVITAEQGAAIGGFDVADWSSSDIRGIPDDLSTMELDNIFLETSSTEDEVNSFQFNVRQDFDGLLSYVKAGAVIRDRSRDRDKDRWSFDPGAGVDGCGDNQACIDMTSSVHSDYTNENIGGLPFMYPFITQGELEGIIDLAYLTRDAATFGEVSIDSTANDYTLEEKTRAAYLMGQLSFADNLSVIAGLRYETTDLSTVGYFSIENDDFEFDGDDSGRLDIALPMDNSGASYSDLFPSVHLRYEPSEEVLIRGSLWTSFTRPSFNQVRTFARIDNDIQLCSPSTGECDDGTTDDTPLEDLVISGDNGLQVGNPNLTRMYSKNFDFSVGWYPNDDVFLQAAFFYKDIDDFIVDVNGAQLAVNELPVSLPVDQITQFQFPADTVFTDVDIAMNGDSATVYGAELSYVHYLESGFFLQSNLTLQSSSAELDDSIRADDIALPDQADTTANLTVGWENDAWSLSLVSYYRSEILEEIGSCSADADKDDPKSCKVWSDQYQDEINSLDFKAKYRLNDRVNFFFDAVNLTDASDIRYFQGNEMSNGRVLYQKENYGKSYQFGFNYSF